MLIISARHCRLLRGLVVVWLWCCCGVVALLCARRASLRTGGLFWRFSCVERSVLRTSAGGQGQVATDAELQCLKVARLLRDVCGSRRPEPAHRHSPLASGILLRHLPQCILSQTCPCHPCFLHREECETPEQVRRRNQLEEMRKTRKK